MKWVLGDTVGRGGSAVVKLARPTGQHCIPRTHLSTGQFCVKIINLDALERYERKSAIREARLLKAIVPHANILSLVDAYSVGTQLHIVTEFCEGGDMHSFIRSPTARYSEHDIWCFVAQLASALTHLHAQRILHRDVKSKNIFLDASRARIKLGDFGIARGLAAARSAADTPVGTPHAMAPEVCAGRPYSWPCDVWGVGCLLFELAARTHPFAAATLPQLLHRIQTAAPDFRALHNFSPDLAATTKMLLAKDPAARISLPTLAARVARLLSRSNDPDPADSPPASFHDIEKRIQSLEASVGEAVVAKFRSADQSVVALSRSQRTRISLLLNDIHCAYDISF
ncbi:Serine/threonine-protein kinase Nek1 [Entophlyctis luteolus]|nr:Serine/threonine-protein kinase Nek1 [Entophlyctis luteolus]